MLTVDDPPSPIRRLPTPLVELEPGLLIKLECNNPGGSHKERAARYIIQAALATGDVVPGRTTVIEKTGGSFGLGLLLACRDIGVPVELAVSPRFSSLKRQTLEMCGASLIGADMMSDGAMPKDVVAWYIENQEARGKSYFYTDQFSNPGSLNAHLLETGPELVHQLESRAYIRSIVFVCCAGTGASLTGISRSLIAAGYDVSVILVEPEGCNSRAGEFVTHGLEGMSVGVSPPFIDWRSISAVMHVSEADAKASFICTMRSSGLLLGRTTAACLAVSRKLLPKGSRDRVVLTLAYDHGFWYL